MVVSFIWGRLWNVEVYARRPSLTAPLQRCTRPESLMCGQLPPNRDARPTQSRHMPCMRTDGRISYVAQVGHFISTSPNMSNWKTKEPFEFVVVSSGPYNRRACPTNSNSRPLVWWDIELYFWAVFEIVSLCLDAIRQYIAPYLCVRLRHFNQPDRRVACQCPEIRIPTAPRHHRRMGPRLSPIRERTEDSRRSR